MRSTARGPQQLVRNLHFVDFNRGMLKGCSRQCQERDPLVKSWHPGKMCAHWWAYHWWAHECWAWQSGGFGNGCRFRLIGAFGRAGNQQMSAWKVLNWASLNNFTCWQNMQTRSTLSCDSLPISTPASFSGSLNVTCGAHRAHAECTQPSCPISEATCS